MLCYPVILLPSNPSIYICLLRIGLKRSSNVHHSQRDTFGWSTTAAGTAGCAAFCWLSQVVVVVLPVPAVGPQVMNVTC